VHEGDADKRAGGEVNERDLRPYVPVDAARIKLLELKGCGIGHQQAAKLAGIAKVPSSASAAVKSYSSVERSSQPSSGFRSPISRKGRKWAPGI
jgi:hypothetical protein